MSEQEFKPGDVAMVRVNESGEVVRAVREKNSWADPDRAWSFRDVTILRRLVVIDPEDTDAVVRLARAYNAATSDNQIGTLPLQAALREYANPAPPRPEEPEAVGTLVTDGDGETWVLDARGNWLCLYSPPGRDTRTWAELCEQYGPISEGVRP